MKDRIRRSLKPAISAAAAAALAAAAFIPARAPAAETRTGWIDVVWQMRGVANRLAHVGVYLVDDDGRAVELSATPAALASYGGVLGLNGRRVTVTGDLLAPAAGLRTPTLRVRSLTAASGPRLAVSYNHPQSGPKPYVVILCRFPDLPDADAHPASTYLAWMGSAYPGMDHFWRENSGDRVSISATLAGPYTLPSPSTAYTQGSTSDLDALANDCIGAADPQVDFSNVAGIAMQFNGPLGNYSWGGSWTTRVDGATRSFGMTWMASWATAANYAHETGHSLGLPHSSGPYGQVYDSRWDVMSGGTAADASVGTWVAPHTIAFYKDLLGWIAAGRKYVAGVHSDAVFDLTRDALPGASGYQMAQIPIGTNPKTFYTVEARRYAGYDAPGRIPGEAVVIHRVNMDDLEPAKVVDVDGNGNPNDDGAMWTPGETFADSAVGVRVSVLSTTATGFRVEISTTSPEALPRDSVLPAAWMGSGYAADLSPLGPAGGHWSVASGALPKGLTLSDAGQLSGVAAEAGAFAFTVNVVATDGYATRNVTLTVVKPALVDTDVFDQLLGGAGLTADQVRFLDLVGNANGRLDVGDVRAWLIDQGKLTG